MNIWGILVIIATVLVISGIAIVVYSKPTTANEITSTSSSSCGYGEDCPYKGSCTAERNCGRSTCGVVNGAGGCGCGR